MPSLPIIRPIKAPAYEVLLLGKLWSFADGKYNPVMRTKLQSTPHHAILAENGMTVSSIDGARAWIVNFDAAGFVLRKDGSRLIQRGREVNALTTNGYEKICLNFWDIYFQRDQAPLSGKTLVSRQQFEILLNKHLQREPSSLLQSYTEVRIGHRGELIFSSGSNNLTLWSLLLERSFARQKVLVVPLAAEDGLALATYSPNLLQHISSFQYDPAAKMAFEWRVRHGILERHYFYLIPPERNISYNEKTLYFNDKAEIGDIYIVAASGRDFTFYHRAESTAIPRIAIEKGGRVVGYIAGGLWPKTDFAPTGRVDKSVKISLNRSSGVYFYDALGKRYSLLAEEVEKFGLKSGDRLFLTFEDGQVVAFDSPRIKEKIYNRVVRNKDWGILSSTRTSVLQEHLKPGIRIIEGLETFEHQVSEEKSAECIWLGHRNITLSYVKSGKFQKRPASIVVKITDKSIQPIFSAFTPYFGERSRAEISFILATRHFPDQFEIFLTQHETIAKQLAQQMYKLVGHSGLSLNQIVTRFVDFFNGLVQHELAISFIIIYQLAMQQNPEYDNRFLSVLANLHRVFPQVSGLTKFKLLKVIEALANNQETREIVKLICQNGLTAEDNSQFKRFFSSRSDLLKQLISV